MTKAMEAKMKKLMAENKKLKAMMKKKKMMGGGMSTMPRMKAAMGKYASISDMEKKCASMTNVNIKVYG